MSENWRSRGFGPQRGGRGMRGGHRMELDTRKNPPIRCVEYKDLEKLLAEEDGVLVLALQDPSFGFKELLQIGKYSNEMLRLVIDVLLKAAGCVSCPQNVLQLLNDASSSSLFTIEVPRYLGSVSRDDSEVQRFKAFIKSLVFLFEKLLHLLSNKSSETLGVALVLMRDVATRFEKDGMPLDESLSQKINDLDQLRAENLARYDAVTRNKLTREESESTLTPPDDFRSMSIFPTLADIHGTVPMFLRANVVAGKYNDVDHYLDVHFRLMREDFVAPLRDGLQTYLGLVNCGKEKEFDQKDIKIYFDVRIEMSDCDPTNGVFHWLSFNVTKLKNVHWEDSSRLMYGSLVCLSSDNFQSFKLGIIINRKPRFLVNGFVAVRFIGGQHLMINANDVYLMAESPAYFEAYSPILRCLQSMNEKSLSFAKYLINTDTNLEFPKYLLSKPSYDFKPLVNESRKTERSRYSRDYDSLPSRWCRVLHEPSWPTADELHLDDNQYAALKLCLTREVAIVQGPPGTGKTFLGLKVVEMLLHNYEGGPPILIVCYTNHALDQFLEGILKFEYNVVRIGGCSKSQEMDSCNLSTLRRISNEVERIGRRCDGRCSYEYSCRCSLYHSLGELQKKLTDKTQLLRGADSRILNLNTLKSFMSSTHFDQLLKNEYSTRDGSDSFVFDWLGLSGDVFVAASTVDKLQSLQIVGEDDDEVEENIEDILSKEEMEDENLDKENEEQQIISKRRPPRRNRFRMSQEVEKGYVKLLQDQEGWQVAGSLSKLKRLVRRELKNTDRMTIVEETGVHDIWALPLGDRWRLYRLWVSKLRLAKLASVHQLQELYENNYLRLKEVLCAMDVKIVRKARVIGMTTTGAAKHREMLQILSPKIVVVEEAAEVLESHIITALTSKCEHLIMIGDQQQLRPNPTVYRLAKDYNLDISLFERLIRNGVPYERLQLQHRMRPRIAQLLVPHIYESLLNHPSVEKYESIRGMVSSVFFVNHSHVESTVSDTSSRANEFEATFLIALCRHLLLQGYRPDQITILTTYIGQVILIKKLMKGTIDLGVRCTAVDNFQGEESDIILLSFVRSNAENNVGFLKVDNRVCVALSRARMGLFCIGNFDFLAKNAKIWKPIVASLRKDNLIGHRLELKCENHPNVITAVECSADFELIPEGGCGLHCDYRLDCGHQCPKLCHSNDAEHSETKCMKPCNKILCEFQHKCTQPCYVECEECLVLVPKRNPICGHINDIPCHQEPIDVPCMNPCKKVLCDLQHKCPQPCHFQCGVCMVIVPKTYPICGHINKIACHENPILVPCTKPCERLVCDLQHKCPKLCHVNCGLCMVIVPKKNPKCGHVNNMPCYKDPHTVLCKKPCEKIVCALQHNCTRLCYMKCGDCLVRMPKKNPICGHTNVIECHKDPETVPCMKPCEKILCELQHKCTQPCSVKCKDCLFVMPQRNPICGHISDMECHKDPETVPCMKPCERILCELQHKCTQLCHVQCKDCLTTMTKKNPICGHFNDMACYEDPLTVSCKSPCEKVLNCGHRCPNLCGEFCTENCDVNVDKMAKCGHTVSVACSQSNNEKFLLDACKHPCLALLSCGHLCTGNCKVCHQGRMHLVCKKKCDRFLICGHPCSGFCGQNCSRCISCENTSSSRCVHNIHVFQLLFSSNDCMKPCAWRCKHLACTKLCHEPCDREPCNEPCTKKLLCGHACIGFCGEPCPMYCRDCNENEVRKGISGLEDGRDARFVLLEDCSHIIESSAMDQYMKQDPRAANDTGHTVVEMKRCPTCKKVIRQTLRYSKVVKQVLGDLEVIKSKISDDIRTKVGKMNSSIRENYLKMTSPTLKDFMKKLVNKCRYKLIEITNGDNLMSFLMEMEQHWNCVAAHPSCSSARDKLTELQDWFLEMIELNNGKSHQQLYEFSRELQRVSLLCNLLKSTDRQVLNDEAKLCYDGIFFELTGLIAFTEMLENDLRTKLTELNELQPGLEISFPEERMKMYTALQMVEGVWYKCPKGHIYAVPEYRGIMQEGRCTECQEVAMVYD